MTTLSLLKKSHNQFDNQQWHSVATAGESLMYPTIYIMINNIKIKWKQKGISHFYFTEQYYFRDQFRKLEVDSKTKWQTKNMVLIQENLFVLCFVEPFQHFTVPEYDQLTGQKLHTIILFFPIINRKTF